MGRQLAAPKAEFDPTLRIGVKLSLGASSLSIVGSPVRDVIAVENSY
jgi:hypothetical protein